MEEKNEVKVTLKGVIISDVPESVLNEMNQFKNVDGEIELNFNGTAIGKFAKYLMYVETAFLVDKQ